MARFQRCDICGIEVPIGKQLNVISFFKLDDNINFLNKVDRRYEVCNCCYKETIFRIDNLWKLGGNDHD